MDTEHETMVEETNGGIEENVKAIIKANKKHWRSGLAQIVDCDGIQWACCVRCGHKLGKINSYTALTTSGLTFETKCQACKLINIVSGDSQLFIAGSEIEEQNE